tara:strand:+ start:1218 stop:1619 length:402 start_codon:yes stop_codon:yes gene_type:complete
MGLFTGFKNFFHNVGHSLHKVAHNVGHHLETVGKAVAPVAKSVGDVALKAGGAVLDHAGAISGVASGVGTTLLLAAPTPVGKTVGVGLLTASAVLGGIAAIRKGEAPETGVKQAGETVKTGVEVKKMLKEAYK